MSIMAESTAIFPASLPSDGLLDLVTIDGTIGRLKTLSSLLAVANGTFFDMPHVQVRKVSAFRVVPRFGRWAEAQGPGLKQQQPERGKSRLGRVLARLGVNGGRSGGGSMEDGRGDGGYISVDGEKVAFEPFQVEVHRALGTVLSRSGAVYETDGPAGWDLDLGLDGGGSGDDDDDGGGGGVHAPGGSS